MIPVMTTKPSPLPAEPPDELIHGMCMTWRHDYGLTRREDDIGLGSGMTEREREGLRASMRQLWQHDIRPYLERKLAEGREA